MSQWEEESGKFWSMKEPPRPAPPVQYFSKDESYTDIVFVVEGRRIHFTKSTLGLCSPVFGAMFEADFAEKGAKEIPLPGKKYDDIVEFFKHLHPAHGPMTEVTDKNLFSLLSLADEYQINSVKEKCQLFIGHQVELARAVPYYDIAERLSVDRNLLYLLACDKFQLQKHKEQLVVLGAGRNVTDLAKSPLYKKFETNSMIDVLRRKCEKK